MRCSYCDIAYALPDPNCRGCGAPKTAHAVRRDLDADLYRSNSGLTPVSVDAPLTLLAVFKRIGPPAIVIGIGLMIFGPVGIFVIAIMLPKLLAAKTEWDAALSKQKNNHTAREDEQNEFDTFAKHHAGFKS